MVVGKPDISLWVNQTSSFLVSFDRNIAASCVEPVINHDDKSKIAMPEISTEIPKNGKGLKLDSFTSEEESYGKSPKVNNNIKVNNSKNSFISNCISLNTA